LIVPVRAGQDWIPLALLDAYVPVRLEAPNVPTKENVQAVLQVSVAPVSTHPFNVAVYCVPFTVPETMYWGSVFCPKDMFHVPDVRPAALASDTVTTPLPLFESTILPEKTVGDGPGTNGNSGATDELLQPITVKHADAASQIYAIPDLLDVACELKSPPESFDDITFRPLPVTLSDPARIR
jgi:hypothetical protein